MALNATLQDKIWREEQAYSYHNKITLAYHMIADWTYAQTISR